MQVYATDKEQMDQVLGFVRKYGLTIIFAIVVFLGVFWGKNYYYKNQSKHVSEASTIYEKLSKTSDSNIKISYANDLVKNYDSTLYAKLAGITLGKEAAMAKKYDDAIKHFSWVYQKSDDWGQLKAMAFENWLRLKTHDTRHTTEGKTQDALDKLNKEAALKNNFSMLFNNLEGDIYSNLGKNEKAIAAYNKVLDYIESNPMLNQSVKPFYDFVLLKRNQIQ